MRSGAFALAFFVGLTPACTLRGASPVGPVAVAPPVFGPPAPRAYAPPPPPVPAPPPEPQMADPRAQRSFLDHLDRPPATLAAVPGPEVTRMALENTVRGEASGMTPETPVLVTYLAEGQRASVPIALPPAACGTYVAEGGLGVVEVDLFLTIGTLPNLQVIAEDPTSGPIAVIGGRDGCFRNNGSALLNADLQVHARRGAGFVLVRVFRKETGLAR